MEEKKLNNLLKLAAETAVEAGKVVMEYFNSKQNKVRLKWDLSPVSIADKKASRFITEKLLETGINIISEEEKIPSYKARKCWEEVWLIDPIDGTREFLRGGSDFTVNIALVIGNEVKMGVIYVPFTGELFYGIKGIGAYKQHINSHMFLQQYLFAGQFSISPFYEDDKITIVTSRSNINFKTKKFIEETEKKIEDVEIIQRGSSLKFCLLAEGKANLFPRFSIINEWDTAAGQAIAEASGCVVARINSEYPIFYNKKVMATPQYIVAGSIKIIKKLS